jgi:hypothetical protein
MGRSWASRERGYGRPGGVRNGSRPRLRGTVGLIFFLRGMRLSLARRSGEDARFWRLRRHRLPGPAGTTEIGIAQVQMPCGMRIRPPQLLLTLGGYGRGGEVKANHKLQANSVRVLSTPATCSIDVTWFTRASLAVGVDHQGAIQVDWRARSVRSSCGPGATDGRPQAEARRPYLAMAFIRDPRARYLRRWSRCVNEAT